MECRRRSGRLFARPFIALGALATGAAGVALAVCGPFTDVAADAFCPFVLEAFTLAITTGTTPTTYDPSSPVTRLQMAAFLSRSVDRVLQRGSRRAALDRYWTTQAPANLGITTLPGPLLLARSDGEDLWVSDNLNGQVFRVHGSSGKLLETWTGAGNAAAVLTAMGKVFVTGSRILGNSSTRLYQIDPGQPPGLVTTLTTNLGGYPSGIAFDGGRLWTANLGASISIVTPTASLPWTVTTVTVGFSGPIGPVFDGGNVWATDFTANTLLKLDAAAGILQTVTVGATPGYPAFDGANIWVPNSEGSSVTVVRSSSGAVIATLTGNGLVNPFSAAFDGQRVLITNPNANSVSLFRAADLAPIGNFGTGAGTSPYGVCSDGISFWITLSNVGELARF